MTQPPSKPTEQLTGLELRAAVAVELFEWEQDEKRPDWFFKSDNERHISEIPPWESDRTAARLVIEHFQNKRELGALLASISTMVDYPSSFGTHSRGIYVGLFATPEQICRAALSVCRERSGTP